MTMLLLVVTAAPTHTHLTGVLVYYDCSLWVKWFGIGFYAPALLREHCLVSVTRAPSVPFRSVVLLPIAVHFSDVSIMI
jgi:hypothetical protein